MDAQQEIIELLGFQRAEGILNLDGISSVDIIKDYGSPLLVFSVRRLISNYESIFKAFNTQFGKVNIAYALKANYLPSICTALANEGAGAEVMTGMELFLAEQAGINPQKIVFNGPAKSPNELSQAARAKVGLINAESLEELKDLAETQWPAQLNQVGIRISPRMSKEIRKNALVRPESKLGLDIERAKKAAKRYCKSPNYSFQSISVHVGCRHPPGLDVFTNSVKELAAFGRYLETELGLELSTVDVGGGFPPRYLLEKTGTGIEDFASAAHEHLAVLRSSPTLIAEPGRYLVGDAAVCLASVVRKKKSGGQTWALLNVGVNVLIPLGFANYDIIPCKFKTPQKEKLSIGGPLCQPNDEFARNLNINLAKGDPVAILNAGAYTLSMAGQFGYPQPGIAKIEDENLNLIRSPKSYDEVLQYLEDQNT
ncbi:MAG: diaminopimelate decarboxylase family protein [Candidatus Heimdallarchaeota archaeon]